MIAHKMKLIVLVLHISIYICVCQIYSINSASIVHLGIKLLVRMLHLKNRINSKNSMIFRQEKKLIVLLVHL